jgi:clan AA aspartic protease (TIGR02281 family)
MCKLLPSLILGAFCICWASNAVAQSRCVVADPTGTPLNIRSEPNGKIVDTLRNGILVEIIASGSSHGRSWAYIGRVDNKLPLGWVFRGYLNCGQHEQNISIPSNEEIAGVVAQAHCLVADPSVTPLNVRTETNGRIVGTLENGVPVRIRSFATNNGRAWARVSAANDPAPLGWVFRDYLTCEYAVSSKPIPGYAFAYRDEAAHSASHLEDCITSCRAAANCSAYVFFVSKKLCRLMTRSDAVLEPNSDAVSGYNNSGPLLPKVRDGDDIGSTKSVIPLENENGTFVVPVQINGAITLDFVVDSGASDVSVPADVVSTLIRTKTIGPSDFVGQQTYVLADGSEAPSDVFIIRSLKIGDRLVSNVKASVASPKATLLLGQSFLRHFKSWSIDNARHALILE